MLHIMLRQIQLIIKLRKHIPREFPSGKNRGRAEISGSAICPYSKNHRLLEYLILVK